MAEEKKCRYEIGDEVVKTAKLDDNDTAAFLCRVVDINRDEDGVYYIKAEYADGVYFYGPERYFNPLKTNGKRISDSVDLAPGDTVDFVGVGYPTLVDHELPKRARGVVTAVAEDGVITGRFPSEVQVAGQMVYGDMTIAGPRAEFIRVDVAPTTAKGVDAGTPDAYEARRMLLAALHAAFPEDAALASVWTQLRRFESSSSSAGLLARIVKRAHGEREAARLMAAQSDQIELD